MIRPDSLRDQFRHRPFQPVRLIVAEGLRYDIYHPDSVIVTERDIIMGVPQQEHGAFRGFVRVSLAHLVAVEEIPAAPAVEVGAEEV